jgi:multiple sugar transport system substrate-binding protein/sn-glycerol 3-phosphate transport system substrate-binding protein
MKLDIGVESPVAGYDECRSAVSEMLTNVLDGADVESELADAINMCNEYLWEAAPEGFAGAAVKPTPIPKPAVVVEYDEAIYGDLENVDPSGQEVTYWYQHTGSREELMLAMIDEFNSTNEWGITVVGETQGGYNDLYQKIIAGIPAKQLPTMAVAYQNQAATYAVQGVLVNLDPYVYSPKWGYNQAELDDFFPIALGADYLPQFDGRFGWPPYKSMEVMYYNEDWLKELGFDGPPTTWEEFEAMACKAVEQPFSGATGEGGSMGYVYSVDASRFATFVFSRGGNIIAPDASGYAFGDQAGIDALTFWAGLTEKGCAMQATESYGDQTDFGNGRSLFTVGSISGLPYYGKAVDEGAGFAWSVNPPPHSTAEPRMNIYGASQSLFVSTPEEQLAAWLFNKFLSEAEQQASWASSTGYFATRQSAVDAMADYMAENPTYAKAFTFMGMDYGIESPVAGYDECRSAISSMVTNVLDGADVESELADAVEVCNEYLEEAAP